MIHVYTFTLRFKNNIIAKYTYRPYLALEKFIPGLHCPGMDLARVRDILFHSGTVPGNPGQLVTLLGKPFVVDSLEQFR